MSEQRTTPFGTYFVPGPTEVRHEVLEAMLRPMIPHRGASYEALHRRLVDGLQPVFRTRRPVYLLTASATGLMEAAIRCAPEGPLLGLVNGAFSERFARIAQACDRRVRVLSVPWGEVHAPDRVAEALAAERYAAMTVVHSETSTGAVNDVRTLAALAHKAGAACLVDSVTGIGGIPLETDAWDLDFVFTGSQKALALPPGLAFGVASESFILQAGAVPGRGKYLDLVEMEEYAAKAQVPHTPALSLLYAADVQVGRIARAGIEARWAAHAAMLAMTEEWVENCRREGHGIGFLAREGTRAPTVSALTIGDGMAARDIVSRTAERGYVIATGYGALRDTTIRIGHMGDHTVDTLRGCLAAVKASLR